MAVTINASTTAGLVNSADTSGILQLQTANTTALTIDASQNVGVGVTPSSWFSSSKALQIGASASLSDLSGSYTLLGQNYKTGTAGQDVYLTTGAASLYSQNAGGHRWYSAPSGTAGANMTLTQAMTLDASGNLGVGTTSPSSSFGFSRVLEISGTTAAFVINPSNTTSGGGIEVKGAAPLRFTTNNTEAARIDSSGNLLVGTTSQITVAGVTAAHALVSATNGQWATGIRNSTSGTPWGLALNYTNAAPNNASSDYIYCYDTTLRMAVRSNGGISNYSGNDVNLSDRREKTNFAPAKSYLETICAIPVQTFNYIDQNMEEDGGLTLGVVAQDVQAVAPELVMESNWGTEESPKMRLSIYQTDLQYALMKCIQEQQALITQLQADVAALKGAQA